MLLARKKFILLFMKIISSDRPPIQMGCGFMEQRQEMNCSQNICVVFFLKKADSLFLALCLQMGQVFLQRVLLNFIFTEGFIELYFYTGLY